MRDPWRNYDRWKTRTPEDEEDERIRRRQREMELEDRADELYQRHKDDPEDER